MSKIKTKFIRLDGKLGTITPKPTELIRVLGVEGSWYSATHNTSNFKFVELIAQQYLEPGFNGLDLIFCHNGDRNAGLFFRGNWNDGC